MRSFHVDGLAAFWAQHNLFDAVEPDLGDEAHGLGEPGDDVVERRTPFYVYLKPHGADDADIKARSKMSGTPPVFIPMPPH